MFLQHAHVSHFRNLEDVEVTFWPGLNVLVGRNNVGKSSLLLALHHALGPAATHGEGPIWPTEDDLHRDEQGKQTSDTIRVTLTFAGLSAENRAQFVEMLDTGHDGKLSVIRLRYEAVWNDVKGRFRVERWGGPEGGDRAAIPPELIQALPLTLLPALRDADAALSPGNRSRLARLLFDYAREHGSEGYAEGINNIFLDANRKLNEHKLITSITAKLDTVTQKIAGSDHAKVAIEAVDPQFSRILRALRIVIPGHPVREISSSGLGYNNLLYIATVLAHLRSSPPEDTPILLIEEPEAHLHPQLTVQLGEYLSGNLVGQAPPQTIVTTHSPTLVSKVKPSQVTVLHERAGEDGRPRIVCNSLGNLGMSAEEERQLQRLIDITRATLYFAKGLILVEGVCEELLLPRLAQPLGHDLVAAHVSVVPLCGVSFGTLRSILREEGLGIPTAIVTDGDPAVDRGANWDGDTPQMGPEGRFEVAPRVQKLIEECKEHPTIRVFHSDVTLEYDLAAASEINAAQMATIWEQYHPGARTLTRAGVESVAPEDRALYVWRGICRASHTASKAGFAHVLAEWLEQHPEAVSDGAFGVPPYLRDAFEWVCPAQAQNANQKTEQFQQA